MFIFDRVVPPPAALSVNLINNPTTSPDPSILKVGANQGYIVAFGKYRQDSDSNGGYLTKPIAWRILDSENLDHNSNLSPTKAGETQTPEEAAINGDAKGLTLFAQKILDNTKRFHDAPTSSIDEQRASSDWRNSDVKSFLNEVYTRPSDNLKMSFYTNDDVFTSAERAAIANTTIKILDIYGSVEPGSNTHFASIDNIFLLSSDEMAGDIDKTYGDQEGSVTSASIAYGFDKRSSSYTQDKNTRAMATDFAVAEGVWSCTYYGDEYDGCWTEPDDEVYYDAGGYFWLRSPGFEPGIAAFVFANGDVHADGYWVGSVGIGVRPALLTNLDSIIFLQDGGVLPWSGESTGVWQDITQRGNLPSELPNWVGKNEARLDDTGAEHVMKLILTASGAHAAKLGLEDVVYAIGKINDQAATLKAITAANEEDLYFDAALLTVPSTPGRQGSFDDPETYYTYSYPYATQVARLAQANGAKTYSLLNNIESTLSNQRLVVFQHKAITEYIDDDSYYQTEYGNGVLELQLEQSCPTIVRADAGLEIQNDAIVALSVTKFSHTLNLLGSSVLKILGTVDFSEARLLFNGGYLDLTALDGENTYIIVSPDTTLNPDYILPEHLSEDELARYIRFPEEDNQCSIEGTTFIAEDRNEYHITHLICSHPDETTTWNLNDYEGLLPYGFFVANFKTSSAVSNSALSADHVSLTLINSEPVVFVGGLGSSKNYTHTNNHVNFINQQITFPYSSSADEVNNAMIGALSLGGNLSSNSVEIANSDFHFNMINIIGAKSAILENAVNATLQGNSVVLGKVNLYGPSVRISGAEGVIHTATSGSMNVIENSLTITNECCFYNNSLATILCGGCVDANYFSPEEESHFGIILSGNILNISGIAVGSDDTYFNINLFGAYEKGAKVQLITNCLNNNQVNIQNSYFYDYAKIYGAFVENGEYSDSYSDLLMQGNKVTISNAVVNEGMIFGAFYDNIYSYNADDFDISNNEVTLLSGRFGINTPNIQRAGSVIICAAAVTFMYNNASITNNKLTIRGTRDTLDLKYADLIGSFSRIGNLNDHLPNASSNQLVVDTENVLARSIHLFDDIKFVLTNERINRLGPNTPMLNTVQEALEDSGGEYPITISFDISGLNIAALDLQEGDYITLVKSSVGIYGLEKRIIQLGSGMPSCTLKVADLNKLTLVVGEEPILKDRFIFQHALYFGYDLAYVNPTYLGANKTYTIARPVELFTDAYPSARMMAVAYNNQRQVAGNTLELRTISANFGGFLETILIGGGIAENCEASDNTLKIIDASVHFLSTDPDDPIMETISGDRSGIWVLFDKLGIIPGALGCLVGGLGSNGNVTNNAVLIGADSFGLQQPEISGIAMIAGGFSPEPSLSGSQTSNINVSGNSAEINNGVFGDAGMFVVGGVVADRDNNYTLFNNRVTVNDVTADCLGIAAIGAGVLGEMRLNRPAIAKLYNNVVNIEGGNFSMVTALLGAGVWQKNYELHDNVVAVNGGNFNFGILGGAAFYQLRNGSYETGEPYNNISGSMRENSLIVDNGEFRYVSLLMGGLGLGELIEISDNLVTINGGHFNNAFLCGIGTVKSDSSSPGVLQNNGVVISGGDFTCQEDGLSPEVWPYSFSAIFATLAATTNSLGAINYQRTDSFVKLENSSNALDLRNVYLAGNVDLMLDLNLDSIIQEEPGESPTIPDKLSKVAKSFTKKLRQEGQEDRNIADIIRQVLDLESALRRWPAHGSTSSLIVARSGVNALGARLFDEIKFVLPADLTSAPLVPMLTLNEALDLNFTDINYRSRVTRITLDTTTNATQFKRGDQLVLIEDTAGIQHFSAANIAGISSDFSVSLSNNQLILQAKKSHGEEGGGGGGGGGSIDVNSLKASTKSVAASAVAVNNTLDVVASNVVNQMTSSTSTSDLFATSVNASKVITGSHVKTFGGSIVLGIARGFNHAMFGVFAEGGLSHFDCFETVKLDSGNSKFAGLGMVLKFDSKSTYLAASLHGGMLRTKTTFKTLTNYLGGFAELGWHLGSFIDAYSRYSYGRTGAIEELVQGTEVNIDPTESHRLRVGAKLMLDNGTFRPYLGFAYEREFKGETKSAIVDPQGSAAPTTSGNSGVIELGTSCALSSSSFIHVNAQVTFGRRQGFGGGLALEHRW